MWAGWRSRYVRSADEWNQAGCLFCRLPGEDDATALILERGGLAFSVLNRFPYSTGHLMVSQYRHVPDLSDLTAAEVVKESMKIAAGICIYTNDRIVVEEL